MTAFLAKIKIATRLYLLLFITALGIAGIVGFSAATIRASLTEDRNEQTRRLVEVANGTVSYYLGLEKAGTLSQTQAQEEALHALATLRYDGKEYFWVNDTKGVMLMHPIIPSMNGSNVLGTKDADGKAIFADMIKIVEEKGAGRYLYQWPPDQTAQPKISYVKGIPEWGWVLGSGVFVQDIDAEVVKVVRSLALTAFIVLIITLILAMIISKSISAPVLCLTETMKRLVKGDLEASLCEAESREDEVGDMGRAVAVFRDNALEVRRLKAEQEQAAARAAEEKRATMERIASDFEHSIGQIVGVVASAATELQANAKNLSEMADQTSRQTSAVAAATEEASASVQTVASAAEELSASIGEINHQVDESSRVAQSAVQEVKKTDETVSTLSEAAQQIGDVVKLIQDIAEQTNLLALNATIEAARAGEAGKGFAVVASEVKNLANQTAKATEEIGNKIVTVQNVSNEAVNAIRSIGSTIEKINEISGVIANAIQQQNAATREISNNVQQASAGTSEVSSSIVGVTHAASESRGAANEVSSAAAELSQQAERMRREIQTFLQEVRQS